MESDLFEIDCHVVPQIIVKENEASTFTPFRCSHIQLSL